MALNDDPQSEDCLARQLADVDEQLASRGESSGSAEVDVRADEQSEFHRTELCLQLINRVRTASGLSGAQFLSTATDLGATETETDNGIDVPTDHPLRIGRFEVIRELGRGGFGIVFLARDTELERNVAIKLPRPDSLFSKGMYERFIREGKTVASLRHANIVPLYDVGRVGIVAYTVSAYCSGPTLAEWMQSRKAPVEIGLAAELVRDLARAIGRAHAENVVHRDLKPGNILLETAVGNGGTVAREQDGRRSKLIPMITDFGLAKVLEPSIDQTRTGTELGTPSYMSPEQAAGDTKQVGPASDIYALGVILYEMLTSRRPCEGESALATLRSIQLDELTPPSQWRPDLPPILEAACLKCLKKRPADRYGTADELAADLDSFLANSAPPRKPPKRSIRPRRLGVVCLVGLVAVCGLFAIRHLVGKPASNPSAQDGLQFAPPTLPAPRTKDAALLLDRRIAEWVLGHGMRIHVVVPDAPGRYITSIEGLPAEPFHIYAIWFREFSGADDPRFDELKSLQQCRTLNFVVTPLTDDQLRRLAGARCKLLRLVSTKVSDDGLRHLRALPNLRRLDVQDTKFTDSALPHITRCRNLTELRLAGSDVSDKGLPQLLALSDLVSLSLWACRGITDSAVETLARMKSLKELDLRDTGVTDAGAFRIKAALPSCFVRWTSSQPDIAMTLAVLYAGGSVHIAKDGRRQIVKTGAALPPGPFRLQEIDLRRGHLNVADSTVFYV